MDDTITTIYFLCDEFLKAIGHKDDPQLNFSSAEVMTVPLVAATFFAGNTDETRSFLSEYGYMPEMVSKSRLNRRLHAIDLVLCQGLFALLAELFKQRNAERTYVVDSLPVPVCDNSSASAAVGSILRKKAPKRSAATSPASGATFMVCAYIWW